MDQPVAILIELDDAPVPIGREILGWHIQGSQSSLSWMMHRCAQQRKLLVHGGAVAILIELDDAPVRPWPANPDTGRPVAILIELDDAPVLLDTFTETTKKVKKSQSSLSWMMHRCEGYKIPTVSFK